MKIYFDESRNTGEIGYNGKVLNYYSQRYFVLVGVVENTSFFDFYKDFLKKHIGIATVGKTGNMEIKGVDLCSKENSDSLKEFMSSITKRDDIYVNVYDKKYFLVSQLVLWLCGLEFKETYYISYLKYCELLHKLNDEFLIEYIKITKDNNKENIKKFIEFILNYEYIECISTVFESEIVKEWVQIIQSFYNKEEYIDILKDSNFENVRISGKDRNNIVNLTALGELILLLKLNYKNSNKDIQIIHDKIEVIQDYIKYYWSFENMIFADSQGEIGVQIADNLASIIGKVINNIFPILNDDSIVKILTSEYKWVRDYSNYIFNNINKENIKFVTTMREAAMLSVYNDLDIKNIDDFKSSVVIKLNERMSKEIANFVPFRDCVEILDE